MLIQDDKPKGGGLPKGPLAQLLKITAWWNVVNWNKAQEIIETTL